MKKILNLSVTILTCSLFIACGSSHALDTQTYSVQKPSLKLPVLPAERLIVWKKLDSRLSALVSEGIRDSGLMDKEVIVFVSYKDNQVQTETLTLAEVITKTTEEQVLFLRLSTLLPNPT